MRILDEVDSIDGRINTFWGTSGEEEKLNNDNFSLALSFERNCNLRKEENIYHHIGIYAYRVETLEKFVNLKHYWLF